MRSTDPEGGGVASPLVSVVMANFQAGEKLAQAIKSVLAQSNGSLELIICDDASSDDSVAIAERFACEDSRVKVISATQNGGPARSRNRGLGAAIGHWIAIVDSDDLIHPERFERLLAVAAYSEADIIADDLLEFFEDGSPCKLFLGEDDNQLFSVSPEQWIAAGIDDTRPLGYLKPLIRRLALGHLRYVENLRIGEDYDLVLRLLLAGAKMMVFPEPYYLYRRHSASISHRLSAAHLQAMLESQDNLERTLGGIALPVAAAFEARREQLEQGLQFERLVEAIKTGRLTSAVPLLLSHPELGERLWQSFAEGRLRRNQRTREAARSPERIELGSNGYRVPGYVPVSQMNWEAPVARLIWLRLAQLSNGRPVAITCPDQAARYAAGFVPMAQLNEAPAELVE
jgi:succinoglycan biosynthesis protein ExoO